MHTHAAILQTLRGGIRIYEVVVLYAPSSRLRLTGVQNLICLEDIEVPFKPDKT